MNKPIKLQLSSIYGKVGEVITYNPSNSCKIQHNFTYLSNVPKDFMDYYHRLEKF